ncbi:hypothetical protein IscW_ISCW007982 [Ixodes scapularis]|uniref:Uncharacterized protein n=1 Tax=Ixodes scapularis TaxID=6945 RepID=B7PUM0_IXOSC|nr:hypothetical protein IscW_ISCW007982 [Ixodes scapularis]|eukprot:XP_002406298.1 hypothetical protein IscW_ISCW007982 [Ixodes scapularis]
MSVVSLSQGTPTNNKATQFPRTCCPKPGDQFKEYQLAYPPTSKKRKKNISILSQTQSQTQLSI